MPSGFTTERFGRKFNKRLKGLDERSGRLEGQVDERRSGFDAREFLREATEGEIAQFREDFGEDVGDLRGNQVGRGRLNSGFGFEEEDQLFENMSEDLNRRLLRSAMGAASLDLENTAGIQSAAESARERDLAMVSGGFDRAQAFENAKRQRKKGRFGFLGSLAGGIIGGVAGGPAGAKAGATIGGGLAGAF